MVRCLFLLVHYTTSHAQRLLQKWEWNEYRCWKINREVIWNAVLCAWQSKCSKVKSTEGACNSSAQDPFINVESQAGEETHGTSLIPIDTERFLAIGSHVLVYQLRSLLGLNGYFNPTVSQKVLILVILIGHK